MTNRFVSEDFKGVTIIKKPFRIVLNDMERATTVSRGLADSIADILCDTCDDGDELFVFEGNTFLYGWDCEGNYVEEPNWRKSNP